MSKTPRITATSKELSSAAKSYSRLLLGSVRRLLHEMPQPDAVTHEELANRLGTSKKSVVRKAEKAIAALAELRVALHEERQVARERAEKLMFKLFEELGANPSWRQEQDRGVEVDIDVKSPDGWPVRITVSSVSHVELSVQGEARMVYGMTRKGAASATFSMRVNPGCAGTRLELIDDIL